MSDNFSNLLNVMAISRHDMASICSCVYCWEVKNSKTCLKCGKKFCFSHTSKHLCFNDSEVWN